MPSDIGHEAGRRPDVGHRRQQLRGEPADLSGDDDAGEGRDLLRLETEEPFGTESPRPDLVRFLSVLSRPAPSLPPAPIEIPPGAEWFVRILGVRGRFVFGEYRRHMKTIGYLGRIDEFCGTPATTRSWNTVRSIVRILKEEP